MKTQYIGDGVYAEYSGYGVLLRTERAEGVHWIILEPDVLDHLNQWYNKVKYEPLNPIPPTTPDA